MKSIVAGSMSASLVAGTAVLLAAACGGGSSRKPSAESAASAPTPAPTPEPVPRLQHPNVLFIAVDDLNDWVACMDGHPDVKTPNIDRLAARGVLFTRAYCPMPLSGPSRTAILTGLSPSTTGVFDLGFINLRERVPGAVTLPERFLANGYDTIGAGKIFHYPNDDASWSQYWHTGGYPEPATKPASGIPLAGVFDWAALDAPYDAFVDTMHVRWTIDRFREPRDKPLFLSVGIIRPHLPWYNPRSFFEMYDRDAISVPPAPADDLADVPPIGRGVAHGTGDDDLLKANGAVRDAVQGYLASITYADSLVGLLLDELDASPMRDNTVVVLWSDHGFHMGEKNHWRKMTVWERSARAPLIISVPGMRTAGEECAAPVSMIDIYPTLTELCGLPPREGLDGRSLVPLLERPDTVGDRVVATSLNANVHGLVDRRWRFISYGNGEEELYDHDSDPHEWYNVASDPQNAEVVERFRALLPAAQPATPADARPETSVD